MNQSDFFNQQRVTHQDMDTFQADIQREFDDLWVRGLKMYGWIDGGVVIPEDPRIAQVRFSYFTGYTFNGKRCYNGGTSDTATWKTLSLARDGYTAIGQGGTADGAIITVQAGNYKWVTILIEYAQNPTDLRATADFTTINYRQEDSFRVRIIQGDEFTNTLDPTINKPSLSGVDFSNTLILADVLLENDGGVVKTIEDDAINGLYPVSHVRKFPLESRMHQIEFWGAPVSVSHYRIAQTGGEVPGGSTDLGLSSYNLAHFASKMHWSKQGAFVWEEEQNAALGVSTFRHGVSVLWPLFNTSTAARNIDLHFEYRDALTISLEQIPNNIPNTSYGFFWNSGAGSGSLRTKDQTLSIPPGRSMLRAYFVATHGGPVVFAQTNEFYEAEGGMFRWTHSTRQDKVIPDWEQIAHLAGRGLFLGVSPAGIWDPDFGAF